MNARSPSARLLSIIAAAGVFASLPLHGQSQEFHPRIMAPAPVPGWAAGAGAGALLGAMVSASH
ncbi:MAG: hypothetical protein ACREUO_10140, partial [Burkholderiales bacterium]